MTFYFFFCLEEQNVNCKQLNSLKITIEFRSSWVKKKSLNKFILCFFLILSQPSHIKRTVPKGGRKDSVQDGDNISCLAWL